MTTTIVPEAANQPLDLERTAEQVAITSFLRVLSVGLQNPNLPAWIVQPLTEVLPTLHAPISEEKAQAPPRESLALACLCARERELTAELEENERRQRAQYEEDKQALLEGLGKYNVQEGGVTGTFGWQDCPACGGTGRVS